jgi:hypothetical protein
MSFGGLAFSVRRATPADYNTVNLDMLQIVLSYMRMLLASQ